MLGESPLRDDALRCEAPAIWLCQVFKLPISRSHIKQKGKAVGMLAVLVFFRCRFPLI